MALNERYSFKDLQDHSLVDRPAGEFNNSTIRGSGFYQEARHGETRRNRIEKHIFPAGMTGVIFENCNLDNVYVPPGNIVVGGTHKLVQVQNDREDWFLDEGTLAPVAPVNEREFIELQVSTDPAGIPNRLVAESPVRAARRARGEALIR